MQKENRVICLACRQCGKCVTYDTKITIRNKKTGKIEEIAIGKLYDKIKENKTPIN